MLSFTPAGLRQVAADVCALAAIEDLTAHAASVEVRMRQRSNP
jgi:histidinol dehydrogenase